jgi:hypothetical protein
MYGQIGFHAAPVLVGSKIAWPEYIRETCNFRFFENFYVRIKKAPAKRREPFTCAPGMGSNLAVKVRYALGSRKC